MQKVEIPFQSQDKSQREVLTFQLYEHSISQRWKNLVRVAQEFGANYEDNAFIYSANIPSDEALMARIVECLKVLSDHFPKVWEDKIFDPIRSFQFDTSQENLNIAHVYFERTVAALNGDMKLLEKLNDYFTGLNHGVHRFEFRKQKTDGIFINSVLRRGIRHSINPDENKLFSLDTHWGGLYLSYCHVGESYVESFYNNYPSTPVPQTKLAGDFNLHFMPDRIFNDYDKLQIWLNNYFGRQVDMKELPLGLVPLGRIEGNFTNKDIENFFSQYPNIGPRLKFIST